MRIAIDIASGDNEPGALLPGALQGAGDTGAELLLVGDRADLENALSGPAAAKVEIFDAPDVIGMTESPVRALIAKPKSSVAVAGSLVAEGKADIFISPGNTGASLVVAARTLGNLPGVLRPALAACLGGGAKPLVLLDVGAGSEVKPLHLAQFGLMGAAYARGALGIERPRVGLLNNGTEPGKGSALYKRAYRELEKIGSDFIGNIEGFDLFSGKADVAVTDGFTGNILVKSISATITSTLNHIQRFVGDRDEFNRAAALPRAQAAQKGAVPLLGVKGGCLVLHGRAGAEDVADAVRMAAGMIRGRVNPILADALAEYKASDTPA